MYGSLMDSLMQSQRNIQDLQRQIASGNKYTTLAENPSAIARSLQVQSTLNANDKYQQNTTNAITMLRYADGAMNNVLDAAQAIRSLIIQAGDGSLDSSQLKDITAQIEANKKIMLDNLNARVAGQYIFGGTDTSTPPFVEQSDGSIVYQGTDERIKYAISESLLGDASFAGSDIVPTNEDSYFICSHNVPIDWTWQGREEKVQITVGNRTLSVFIPEDWQDYDNNTGTGETNTTDYNRYRDPNESTGLSLDDLAEIVNRSLEEQGADMLVKVTVEKDYESGTQQMIMKSNTGEKIGITGWPDTDYMPMPAQITSNEFEAGDTSWRDNNDDDELKTNGLMGSANILSWKGSDSSGSLTISVGGKSETIDLTEIASSTDLITELNSKFSGTEDGTPFASFSTGHLKGRLILQSDAGEISVSGEGMSEIFGTSDGLTSTKASLTITTADDSDSTAKIFINGGDTLSDLASRINSIEGVYSRVSGDGTRLIVTAQRTGALPEDRLANNDAAEELNYPSLMISGEGSALELFAFEDGQTTIKALSERRNLDHSHIDIFDYLGMETAMKSREFATGEELEVAEGTQLHWRVMSGGRSTDIKLNSGEYSLEELADRIRNAGAGWLEVTLEDDKADIYGTKDTDGNIEPYTQDGEEKTQRLVIRGYNGEQVLFLDMNEYNYADQLGLSTALRTDAYTDDTPGTGTRCVNFPSAPCVDDNVGIQVRVQMNCGMYYDVNIKRAYVIDPETGFVDRNKVMREIVDGVNEQEGHDIMGLTVHVDENGEELDNSSAIYFLSGEAFTVVDMPFTDPVWSDYSGGIAAQLGIHGGVTSNLAYTEVPIKDSMTFQEAYDEAGATGSREPDGTIRGTIRFASLGHEVEIDVSSSDTVKDVMDRLRVQAGDWLYVNYYDQHMGQAARNSGDYPLISLSAVDGSAVSVLDVKGHIAQDALGISTGVQTRLNPDGDESDDSGIMGYVWDMDNQVYPAAGLTLTVAGYEHTIDLTEIREVTDNTQIQADDIAKFICSRMQDYDVLAEVNKDNELMIWSARGYSVEVKFTDSDGESITDTFLGDEESARSYYRGGYNLDGASTTRGIDSDSFYAYGLHSQNATIRSGANTMRQNGFGIINDVISAIESGNRDDLTDKMLPKIDDFISNLLSVMSENGALQARYNYNNERLTTENSIMTETYDDLVKVDPAEAISQLMIADYMYQANLSVISRLIQPSLLDFLR